MLNKITIVLTIFLAIGNIAKAETLTVYSTEGDGQIQTQESIAWSDIHTATIGDQIAYDIGSIVAQVRKGANGVRNVARSYLSFGTSILPEGAVITDAKLVGYVVGNRNDVDSIYSYVGVYQGFQEFTDKIVETDIDNCGDLIINPTLGSDKVFINSTVQGTYVDFKLNPNGLSWINLNGFTKLCLREGHDAENIEYNPLGSFKYADLGLRSANWIGVDQDPRLEITYTILKENVIENPVNLLQNRVDGVTMLGDGEGFVGNGVVFEGEVGVDDDGVMRGLEVEVKQMNEEFDETGTHISELGTESVASVLVTDFFTHDDLYGGNNEGDFKWRARTIDENGEKSEWVEFGNDETDFSLKAVPLVTQVVSPYPDESSTAGWASALYAGGDDQYCGETIAQCGCALSSLSTLAYHHGITTGVDGSVVNPKNLNDWLMDNNGFDDANNIKWLAALEYFSPVGESQSSFFEFLKKTDDVTQTNNLLAETPVIAFDDELPGGYSHFFVLDSQLNNGYEVSDPQWFNTMTTDEIYEPTLKTQDYDDSFKSARLIKVNTEAMPLGTALEVHHSGGELLVTDADGNKLGEDPMSETIYRDIENGDFGVETSIYSGDETPTGPPETWKVVRIFDTASPYFIISISGEAASEYFLSIFYRNEDGDSSLDSYDGVFPSTGELILTAGELTIEGKLLTLVSWMRSQLSLLPGKIGQVLEGRLASLEALVYAKELTLPSGQERRLEQWFGNYIGGELNVSEYVGLITSLFGVNK